ncbi:MAG: murein biosynthesis integral membrane protein MurJ [Candidatus Shapirobacteria bacterium]|jgi:putative peptidoglycan lipid II flippase
MTIQDRIKQITTQKQSTIISASIVLGLTFGLSAILGFLRSRFLYSRFFSCCVSQLDAYNAAFRLPDLLFKLLVTGALSASFIPVFSSYLHQDEKRANKMASVIINLLLLIFISAGVLALIFTRPISELIATGFSPAQIDLMVGLSRILLIAQLFFLISNFITGILQVHQAFLIPAFSPIIYNIFIILGIFALSPTFGIYGVAYGVVVGAFFHLAIQIPVVRKFGFHYSFTLDTKSHGVREVFRLMLPRSLSLGLGEIENTVTLFFASTLAVGSISLLNLALQLIFLPSRIFGTTVGQASLPILSKNIAHNELDQFKSTVDKAIFQSLFISLPVGILMLVLRLPIVRIVFGARQFPWSATLQTARILAFLFPVIVCQAVIQILIRSFYALHNTKTPLYVSAVSLTVNVLINFLLINFTSLGVVGLAISTSVGNLIQMTGLFYLFCQIVPNFVGYTTFLRVGKIFLASASLGLSSWLALRLFDSPTLLDTSKTVNLIFLSAISFIIGGATYLFVSRLLRVSELEDYKNIWLKFKAIIRNFKLAKAVG